MQHSKPFTSTAGFWTLKNTELVAPKIDDLHARISSRIRSLMQRSGYGRERRALQISS